MQPPSARYADAASLRTFTDEALRRVGEIPGVSSVAASSDFPFRGRSSGSYVAPEETPEARIRYHRHSVTPGYFDNLGIRLEAGRLFLSSDDENARGVAVVTDAFVRRVFPGEPTGVGRTFWIGDPSNPDNLAEIVGVVENVRYRDLTQDMMAEPNSPDVFFMLSQVPSRTLEISYRVDGDPEAAVPAVREAMRTLDPDVPVFTETTLRESYLLQTATPRFAALLMAFFSAVALSLACVGIYGVLAYAVGRRARELAVRRALGARATDVARDVIWQGLSLAILGCVVGGAIAFAGARVLDRFLFGVEVTDTATLAATVLTMLAVSALAAAVPAWRASRRAPTEALAAE